MYDKLVKIGVICNIKKNLVTFISNIKNVKRVKIIEF